MFEALANTFLWLHVPRSMGATAYRRGALLRGSLPSCKPQLRKGTETFTQVE
jgi:hypothetical protein